MTGLDASLVLTALPAPCWWIDPNHLGDWEIAHHDTRGAAEEDHANQIRSEYGWVLTVAGAFAILPGRAVQEVRRCYVVSCPGCEQRRHVQKRFEACAGCGYRVEKPQIPLDDPRQLRLFTVSSGIA